MFCHIGNGKSVPKKDIIGIFDLDTATVSRITKGFINEKQKNDSLLPMRYGLSLFLLLMGITGIRHGAP